MRKPIDQTNGLEYPPTKVGIWKLIRENKEEFAISDLRKCEATRETIRGYLKQLLAAGIIQYMHTDFHSREKHYCLIKNLGSEAPVIDRNGEVKVQVSAVANMWRTIRMSSGPFNADQLSLLAATEDCPIEMSSAQRYLEMVSHHECFRIIPHKKGKKGLTKYQFIKALDPGPKPLRIQRSKQVFDPNTDTVVWQQEPKEVKP